MSRIETAPAIPAIEDTRDQSPVFASIGLLASRVCMMVSGYLVSTILARNLGPTDYGVYGAMVSLLIWIEVVGHAGMAGTTAKLIATNEREAAVVEETARLLSLTLALPLFALCWLLAPTVAQLFNIPNGTTIFRLAILDIPLSSIYVAYLGILNGHRRFGSQSVCFIICAATKIVGVLSLFVFGFSVAHALITNTLATAGVLVYLLTRFPPQLLTPSHALVRSFCRLLPSMGSYVISLQLLLSIDLWCLKGGQNIPGEIVGMYVAALNVAKVPAVVSPALSAVLFSSLSWALARSDETAAQRLVAGAGRFGLIVIAPCVVLLAIDADGMMTLLYSGIYAPGASYLTIQVVAFGALVLLDMFFNALLAAGKHNQVGGILLGLLPVTVVVNLVLIPIWGAIGAALSLTLAVSLATTIGAVLTYQRFGRLIDFPTLVRILLATGIMAGSSLAMPVTAPWLVAKLVIVLMIYVLLLVILHELAWKDLNPWTLFQKGSVNVAGVTASKRIPSVSLEQQRFGH